MSPAAVRPHVFFSAAEIETNAWLPTTFTGTGLHGVDDPAHGQRSLGAVPLPSWPQWSHPQQYVSPVLVMPHVCQRPAERDMNERPPDTATGVPAGTTLVVPFPYCARSFVPQQYAAPVSVSAQVCDVPSAADTKCWLP